jgi:hypothetical protein
MSEGPNPFCPLVVAYADVNLSATIVGCLQIMATEAIIGSVDPRFIILHSNFAKSTSCT